MLFLALVPPNADTKTNTWEWLWSSCIQSKVILDPIYLMVKTKIYTVPIIRRNRIFLYFLFYKMEAKSLHDYSTTCRSKFTLLPEIIYIFSLCEGAEAEVEVIRNSSLSAKRREVKWPTSVPP